MKSKRDEDKYGTGFDDGLEPLVPLDVGKLDSVNALVSAMANTAFGGRRLGEAADVLETMVRDENCFRVVTISGAMTIAKQGLVLCEMIDRGWVQAVVATGALMTHGVVEGAGMLHFKHRKSMDDTVLYERGYNRVYDTIELEKNLDSTEAILNAVLGKIEPGTTLCSHVLLARVGELLDQHDAGRAILRSAVKKSVPIYVPAFTDSELGLDFAIHNRRLRMAGQVPFAFDPFLDLEDFAPASASTRRWASSRSAAACPATGRSRSRPSSRSRPIAWAPASRSVATVMRCASAPSPSTGAASRAVATARVSPGASSCPRATAGAMPRSIPTRRSPGPSSSAP